MMGANSKIEWCDHTWNPWLGCARVSPGCANCYAAEWARRFKADVKWGDGHPRVRTSESNWRLPLTWNRKAEIQFNAWEKFKVEYPVSIAHGFVKPRRPRVFCGSLCDIGDDNAPSEWRVEMFDLIRQTPYLDWLILTKRIANVSTDEASWRQYPNVWLGATVCNQTEADRDIPILLKIPAAKLFLSIEPMLGPVEISKWLRPRTHSHDGGCWTADFAIIDWVICGGETSAKARPIHPDWVRTLRDQCKAADVPFFFKQWGEWAPTKHRNEVFSSRGMKPDVAWPDGTIANGTSDEHGGAGTCLFRIGKKRAGRLLDGREWNEMPL
jgi:protein gp37